MRLQNPNLTEGAKLEIKNFAFQLFSVEEKKNIITNPNTKITSVFWIHGYMKRISIDLISKIYFSTLTILLTTQYLVFFTILAIANVDVTRLNNLIFEMMKEE